VDGETGVNDWQNAEGPKAGAEGAGWWVDYGDSLLRITVTVY